VAGVLPLADVPALRAGGSKLGLVRGKLEVTTPGKVKLRLNSADGLRLWLDGSPVAAGKEVVLDLKSGPHTVTFAVDLGKRREGLRVELADVAGSPAQVRMVGGK
jgi:hypothetical protein